MLGVVARTGGSLASAPAAYVPDNSPGMSATSTCSLDGSGFWWMRLGSRALFYSPNATRAASDLSGAAGAWAATGQPSACAVSHGALYVAVAWSINATTLSVFAAAPALPTSAAGLSWTAVATLSTPSGAASGFALSPDGLSIFVAVANGGVARATRATRSLPFSAFVSNAASSQVAASDVIVSGNSVFLYVLTPSALARIDLRGDWSLAALANVSSAPSDGSKFLGVALAPN